MRRAAALLTLIASSAVLLPAADRLSFELAVLRRDGIMVPFAAYNGHDWSAPWPTSDSNVVLPIGLDDVPKKWWGPVDPASKWTALMAADGSRRPVKLERPEQFRAFCGGHIGLRTDYTAGPVDNHEPSVAKDALAIAGGPGEIPVEPIVEVSTYSPDAGRVIGMIIGDFNKEEKKAAMRFTRWMHPYSALERAAMPIHLEALYRFREKTPLHGEWLANYVEAIRRFPASPYDRECGLITWVRGWVIEREGKAPDVHITATITYCDREGVSFMQPLGHLRIDGENYWVYQTSSWRDEIYTVARMAPEEVRPVLNVFGGGCPKEAAR